MVLSIPSCLLLAFVDSPVRIRSYLENPPNDASKCLFTQVGCAVVVYLPRQLRQRRGRHRRRSLLCGTYSCCPARSFRFVLAYAYSVLVAVHLLLCPPSPSLSLVLSIFCFCFCFRFRFRLPSSPHPFISFALVSGFVFVFALVLVLALEFVSRGCLRRHRICCEVSRDLHSPTCLYSIRRLFPNFVPSFRFISLHPRSSTPSLHPPVPLLSLPLLYISQSSSFLRNSEGRASFDAVASSLPFSCFPFRSRWRWSGWNWVRMCRCRCLPSYVRPVAVAAASLPFPLLPLPSIPLPLLRACFSFAHSSDSTLR